MESTTKLIDPTLWSQVGGLNGLVILALFISLGLFVNALAKIYQMNRDDFKSILEMHAKERESWGRIIDARQQETNQAIQAMAAAISELNLRSRRFSNGDSHHGP